MAEPDQSKKDTVRIALPTEAGPGETSPENPRLNLPARPPVNTPASSSTSNARQDEETATPRKETARVAPPTDPPSQRSSAVEMKKTQPLFTMPGAAEAEVAPLTVTSGTEARVETIPVALCWTVFAVSALILIIQIWNYLS
jgi:hypothetical protein